MRERNARNANHDKTTRKQPDPDARAPRGIAAAALRGAMRSRRQRPDEPQGDGPQARPDDDPASRRADGKPPA